VTTIRTGAVELSYERLGSSGDPVVLVHGSLADSGAWGLVAAPLAASLQLLVYDRRGYGSSRGPPRGRSVRDDAEDLAGLLEGCEFYPAHVVAHSYAGSVALRLACDRPELVRSLVLHEPPIIGLLAEDPTTATEAAAGIARLERLRALVGQGQLEPAARELTDAFSARGGAWDRLHPEARRLAVEYVSLWRDEFSDSEAWTSDPRAVGELLIPILLTTGAESPPWIRAVSSRLAALLRNVTEQSVPESGHAPHLSVPDRYVGILQTFLLERIVPSV
jgi:pimeloyl-ACP methyl ester carboxylesterase